MFCVICQKDVYYCTCPDIEERLRSIAASSGHWAMETCLTCGEHADRCTCPDVGQERNTAMLTVKEGSDGGH